MSTERRRAGGRKGSAVVATTAVALIATLGVLIGCANPTGSNAANGGDSGGGGDDAGANQVSTPVIAPSEADQFLQVEVSISVAEEEVTIHYTTDGSEPTSDSTAYSAPFALGVGTHTVRAIAVAEGLDPSAEATRTYAVADGVLVSSNADSGEGSLRHAVADADPGNEIRFAEDMTITLEGDRRGIEIDKDITVNGVGRTVIIEGSGAQRHFSHMPGGPYELTIANLTLRNGEPRMSNLLPGGSIYIATGSTAMIENVTFEDNLGTTGGAIFVEQIPSQSFPKAVLEIRNSTFRNNEARGVVGAGGAAGAGGALYAQDTDVTIENATFSENFADTGNAQLEIGISGGALFLGSSANLRDSENELSKATIRGSSFLSNEAGRRGGAIMAEASDLDLIDSLFEENRAGSNGTSELASWGTGGAVYAFGYDNSSALRVGLSRFVRNRSEGPVNHGQGSRYFAGGAVATNNQGLQVYSSEFFGNVVTDTGDGQSTPAAPNTGAAIFHHAETPLTIAGTAFVGNRASGTNYENTFEASAVVSGFDTIPVELLFSSFAANSGAVPHANFLLPGDDLLMSGTAIDNGSFTLPDSDSGAVVRYNTASASVFAAGEWAGHNNQGTVPAFTRSPEDGVDNIWGTSDDDYGNLAPAGANIRDRGNINDLPSDVLDLDGDGNTTEGLPLDAAGRPRKSGVIDVGAYES
ncbi:MAG: chitobiase/beta-hexosaminidase C-terminal domain-containing protein [Spirochaetaceae bacterium]